jgi:hypothetical protein
MVQVTNFPKASEDGRTFDLLQPSTYVKFLTPTPATHYYIEYDNVFAIRYVWVALFAWSIA